ncbi:MAG TPA: SAM-dependent methyltransferase [Streptosporangiaceae bacterium]
MTAEWFQGTAAEDATPVEIDTSVAHPARVYDYWLGGKDNYPADRAAGEAAATANPAILTGVRANRRFLRRAVHYLADQAGVRQFLDIGTGLPSVNNTHQVAQSIAPDSRVVYVDNDPVVLAHARALLTSSAPGETAYISADARDVDLILTEAARTLDFSRPVAILALMVLQYIPDSDDPHSIVSRLLGAVPSGSYFAESDTARDIDTSTVREATRRLNERMPTNLNLRSRDEIARFYQSLELLEPGLVPLNRWRPDPEDLALTQDLPTYCGIGRKP